MSSFPGCPQGPWPQEVFAHFAALLGDPLPAALLDHAISQVRNLALQSASGWRFGWLTVFHFVRHANGGLHQMREVQLLRKLRETRWLQGRLQMLQKLLTGSLFRAIQGFSSPNFRV
jgi:hypothetical protein